MLNPKMQISNSRVLLQSSLLSMGIFCAGVALAETPADVRDLVGVRASSGESALQSRGYEFVRTQKGDDRNWSYWRKPATGTCITVATFDGRYDAITSSPNDCGSANSGSTAAKVAGAALAIGAIAAIAKHEHDKEKKEERREREHATPDEVKNLPGTRGSSAENVLIRNGYRHIEGHARYTSKQNLWWNESRQDCLAIGVYDGRIDSLNKVGNEQCSSHQDSNSHLQDSNAQSYSPAANITCYPAQKTCYRFGKGVDQYWTSIEF